MEENLKEIWRPATDVDGNKLGDIEVSNLGNVRGATKFLHQGYIDIVYNRKGYRFHRIVAKAFPDICGEWFDGCHVHHKNFNKLDNRAENLAVMDKFEHLSLHKKGVYPSEETRKKLSEASKGKHPSEEARKKMSIAHRRENLSEETRRKLTERFKGEKSPNWGKHKTEEVRQKLIDSSPHKKTIYQYSLDGEYIRSYKSVREAARIIGCSGTAIGHVCRGTNKTAKGFKWGYEQPKE